MEKNMRRNQKIHRNVGFFKRKYDEKKHDLENKLGRKLTKQESEKFNQSKKVKHNVNLIPTFDWVNGENPYDK